MLAGKLSEKFGKLVWKPGKGQEKYFFKSDYPDEYEMYHAV